MRRSKATTLTTIGLTLGAFAALPSCSGKDDRQSPPMLEDCVDANCKPAGGSGSGTSPGEGGGGTGGGGTGGGGQGPSDGDGTAVTVSGTVVSTLDAGFLTVAPYMPGVVVRAKGLAGAQVSSEGAAGQFTIDDVATGLNWFALEDPTTMPAFLPTLQPVMVDASDPKAQLAGVDEQTFDNLLYALQPSKIRVQSSGQAIVFFARRDESPVNGAIIHDAAFAELVAYDTASGYEAVETPKDGATGPQGTAILFNIPAVAYPGSAISLRFEIEGKEQQVQLQVASGYVTRAAIAVD